MHTSDESRSGYPGHMLGSNKQRRSGECDTAHQRRPDLLYVVREPVNSRMVAFLSVEVDEDSHCDRDPNCEGGKIDETFQALTKLAQTEGCSKGAAARHDARAPFGLFLKFNPNACDVGMCSKELIFTLKLDRAGATEDSVTINNALYLKGNAEDKEAQLATEPDPPAPPAPLEQPLPPPLEQPAPEAVLPDVVRSSTRSRKRARLSHPSSEAAASEPVEPLPTIVDHLEDSADLSIGLTVLAYGRSPGGDWTKYRAVIKAFRDRAPYVVVKYTTDMSGNALRLLLPSPITAYLSRTDIELL